MARGTHSKRGEKGMRSNGCGLHKESMLTIQALEPAEKQVSPQDQDFHPDSAQLSAVGL